MIKAINFLFCIFLLCTCYSAFSHERLRYVGVNNIDHEVTSFYLDNTSSNVVDETKDHVIGFYVCADSVNYHCLVTFNAGLSFFFPKGKHEIGEKWSISGYEYLLRDIKTDGDDIVYVISSTVNDLFFSKDNYSRYRFAEVTYVYSINRGIISFYSVKRGGEKDPKKTYYWTLYSQDIDYQSWLEKLPKLSILHQDVIDMLSSEDITLSDFVDIFVDIFVENSSRRNKAMQ